MEMRTTTTYYIRFWLLLGAALVGLTGCLRDHLAPCPPLTVTLTVTDKNYFNIADAEQYGLLARRDENLPFRSYVGTLYYVLQETETGTVVAKRTNYAVEGDALTQEIAFDAELPYGTYTLTVWGNMKSDEPLGDDATAAELESADAVSNDIYLGTLTMDYDYSHEHYTLGLERTKGQLLIQAEGLPDYIDFSVKDITHVYNIINSRFEYSNPVDVRTRTDWQTTGGIVTHTLLGPSESSNASRLSVYFLHKDEAGGQESAAAREDASAQAATTIVPEDVNITLRRNELTLLRYVYSSQTGMKIFILVNGQWEYIHDMEID